MAQAQPFTFRCQGVAHAMEESASQEILLIEDSTEDHMVAQDMRRQVTDHPIMRCRDGDSAPDYLLRRGTYAKTQDIPRPTLILLDLNLPAIDGCEALRQIKQDPRLRTMPMVVFTTSAQPQAIHVCYQLGANSYMVKPIDFERLRSTLELLMRYWFSVVKLPERRSP
jgi:CheY-like chemotaxis protein